MIFEILGFACLVVVIMNFDYYHKILEFLYLDIKPFTCTLCMGFWLTIGTNAALHGWYGVLLSALEAVIAEFIDRQLNKF